jgi:hypothetical protein
MKSVAAYPIMGSSIVMQISARPPRPQTFSIVFAQVKRPTPMSIQNSSPS